MPRITSQKTRQFLLVTGDPLDPDELPEKMQLFDADGHSIADNFGGTARRDLVIDTGVLAAAVDTGNINDRQGGGGISGQVDIGKGVMLLRAVTNRPCRLRFYTTAAHRDDDITRDRFTDPNNFGNVPNSRPNHGNTSELLLLSSLTQDVTPAHYIWPGDSGNTVYFRIANYDIAAGAVALTLTIKDVEL